MIMPGVWNLPKPRLNIGTDSNDGSTERLLSQCRT